MSQNLRTDARLFPTVGAFFRFRCNWLLAGRRYAARRQAASNVVVSLTSYPPRFSTLHLTLMSLLAQSFAPARIVLWVAYQDVEKLPDSVTALTRHGLEIRACEDLRSYKKLIPQLQTDPHSVIVTADDDVYYWRNWLKELVDAYQPGRKEVIAHRVHRVRMGGDGLPLPYTQWEYCINDLQADDLHFPTGIGGVLYPPGVLGEQVLQAEQFMALCPRGDDIWFWWMARRNGARFRRAPSANHSNYFHCWDGSQECALWEDNVSGNFNDTQIAAMIEHFGFSEERKIA
ncbi:glycosyltransferase family 2 protein [Herbaspirillum huttiense]|uniref:glycosyltransferase family 2 protein n=1 Tax=Herbaspirillum huttiense TaxID=863372 RepID=UPI0010657279|nr:glycosyltransferase family 2 protein [Herbaspirillum huttiense]QBP75633.1 glycosyltransferase family 2 protein [Herbaspirillum huttiense]